MKKFIVSLICVTAVFSGCAGSNESETKKLTLLAYDSFTPTEGIFDEFTQETGISVEVILGGDTGQLISKAIDCLRNGISLYFGLERSNQQCHWVEFAVDTSISRNS
jgi:ABC-type thiamine transport system substrate-binding protein